MTAVSIPISNTARNLVLALSEEAGERTRRGRLARILENAEGRFTGGGMSYPVELKADLVLELEKTLAEAKASPEIELSAVEREAIRLLRLKIQKA